jgi:hypothetical protein
MALHLYLRSCITAAFGILALSLLGSAQAQDKSSVVPVDPPPKTIKIEIDLETLKYQVVEPKGARACSLCTAALEKEFGKGCEGAIKKNVNICQGLVNATVQDLNHIILLRSRKNPYCITVASGNYGGTDVASQLCFCLPTDTNCPARAWYQ